MPRVRVEDLSAGPKMPDFSKMSKSRKDWLGVFGNTWAPAKVMPGTCDLCVFGEGEHAADCEKARADIKLFGPLIVASVGGGVPLRDAVKFRKPSRHR